VNDSPKAEDVRTVERSVAFFDRGAATVRGYSGAVASLDTQRARALGAAERLRRRLKGKPPSPHDLATISDAAGLFLARYRREGWREYTRHPWRPVLDVRFPLLNATLWRLCQES
jgi:hypothetical protein